MAGKSGTAQVFSVAQDEEYDEEEVEERLRDHALFIAFAFVQREEYDAEQPAIVFATECLVKSEPNNRSTEVFLLHEGTKVQVIEGLEEYNRIELADGKTGWVLEEDIRLLKDF